LNLIDVAPARSGAPSQARRFGSRKGAERRRAAIFAVCPFWRTAQSCLLMQANAGAAPQQTSTVIHGFVEMRPVLILAHGQI
jgi:hypothetical protein